MAGHNYERYGSYHVVPVGMTDGFENIVCDMLGGWIVNIYTHVAKSKSSCLQKNT